MADSTKKAKHAFGSEANIDAALAAGTIDAYDILFLDEKKVGWIDKNGQKVILEDKTQVVRVNELPTENGDPNVVYVMNNSGYVWDETTSTCVPLAQSADVEKLQEQVNTLETTMSTKVDESTVDTKIEDAIAKLNQVEIIEF